MLLLVMWTLRILVAVLTLATAASLVGSNQWWIRIFDFPRLQIAVAIILTLASYLPLAKRPGFERIDYVMLFLAVASLLWQGALIVRYTPLFPTELAAGPADDKSSRITLFICNVLHDNKQTQPLLDLIAETNPDLILLTEPTRRWQDKLAPLEQEYPHTLLQAQENEYGMLLYSRLELVDPEIRFLIEDEIPSMRTGVKLRSGAFLTLYGLHPRPPGIKRPDDNGRVDSNLRDGELLMVAKEVEKNDGAPVLVAGDFNDVAWSHTTRLFQRTSKLLDPRVGRGMYNTFDADSYLLRYPLDHIFASNHFLVAEVRRLPYVESDHFPMLVTLTFNPEAAAQQPQPQSRAGDAEEVEEAINDAK